MADHAAVCASTAPPPLAQADSAGAVFAIETLPTNAAAIIARMATSAPAIAFRAPLLLPVQPARATWSFVLLPKMASKQLPSRGMVSVAGTLGGRAFKATLSPDGHGSHWLKVPRALREAAGAKVGDAVTLSITPVDKEPEPKVPQDLRKALVASSAAKAQWAAITPVARRDFVQWVTTAKHAETRTRRIRMGCDMLAAGKRRVCCFDRSGMYDKSASAPEAAPLQGLAASLEGGDSH